MYLPQDISYKKEQRKGVENMSEYNPVQWLAFFYSYCFLGWCYESIYCSIKEKKLTNRGFINGPFLPIYGSGAIVLLLVANPVKDNIILTFIIGMIGATILELITGIVMESIFKVRYWDYSESFHNFKGYISIAPSLLWGLMGVLLMNVVHSPIERLVLMLEYKAFYIFVFIITICMAIDFAISFRTAIDLRNILINMEQAKVELSIIQNRMNLIIAAAEETVSSGKEFISKGLGERKRHYEEQISVKLKSEIKKLRKQYKRRIHINESLVEYRKGEKIKIFKRNPSITSKKFAESLEELKNKLLNKRDKGTD